MADISLTKEQLDFILFIASKVEKSSELSKKMDKCCLLYTSDAADDDVSV